MSNPEVNEIVDKYMMAKHLPLGERSPALIDRLLDQAGLIDNPDLLIQLEHTYQEAQRLKNLQAEAKAINFKRNNSKRG